MYDDFNVFCINDYYDYPTYKGYAVPVSEIELNSPLRSGLKGLIACSHLRALDVSYVRPNICHLANQVVKWI